MIIDSDAGQESSSLVVGVVGESTEVTFKRKKDSPVSISGVERTDDEDVVWSFEGVGVGGMDEQLSDIYR